MFLEESSSRVVIVIRGNYNITYFSATLQYSTMTGYIQLSYLLYNVLTFMYYNITHTFCMNITISRILITISPIVACHAPSPRTVWYSVTYTPSKMMNAHRRTMPCFSIVSIPTSSCQNGHLLSTYSLSYIYGGHNFHRPSFCTKFQLQFTHHGQHPFIVSASTSTPRMMCYTVL